MDSSLFFLVFLLGSGLVVGNNQPFLKYGTKDTGEIGLTVEELIQYHGYPLETHEVETEDQYLLTVFRIPHGTENGEANKGSVLLVPGLFCDSGAFLLNGKENSLGFVLADAGYDVWLLNPRGTTYSRKHVMLNPDEDRDLFWDFSFHEIGVYDATASIDYMIRITGEKQVFFAGHSQGTTDFFAMASYRPEYNEKIRLAIALAPVAYLDEIPHLLMKYLADHIDFLTRLLLDLNLHELIPKMNEIPAIASLLCKDGFSLQYICLGILEMIADLNLPQTDTSRIPIMTSYVPAGASYKQLAHFAQGINSGKFAHFDNGDLQNYLSYGERTPEEYNIEQITAPVALFYAKKDLFASLSNVEKITSNLPNVVLSSANRDENFTHLDFMIAKDATELLYNDVISIMDEY